MCISDIDNVIVTLFSWENFSEFCDHYDNLTPQRMDHMGVTLNFRAFVTRTLLDTLSSALRYLLSVDDNMRIVGSPLSDEDVGGLFVTREEIGNAAGHVLDLLMENYISPKDAALCVDSLSIMV